MSDIEQAFRDHRQAEPKAFSVTTLHDLRTPTLFCLGPVDETDSEAYDWIRESDGRFDSLTSDQLSRLVIVSVSSPTMADSADYKRRYGVSLEADVTFLRAFEQFLEVSQFAEQQIAMNELAWIGFCAATKGVLDEYLANAEHVAALNERWATEADAFISDLQEKSGSPLSDVESAILRTRLINQLRNLDYYHAIVRYANDSPELYADFLRPTDSDYSLYLPRYLSEVSGGQYSEQAIKMILRAVYNPTTEEFALPNPNPLDRSTPTLRGVPEVQSRLLLFLLARWGRVLSPKPAGGWEMEAITEGQVLQMLPAGIREARAAGSDTSRSLFFEVLKAAKLVSEMTAISENTEVADDAGKDGVAGGPAPGGGANKKTSNRPTRKA